MTNGIHKHLGTKMAIPAHEDTGFCSGDEYFENEIHSPTDNSEDSVDVKVSPILSKNKRKLVEPRKVEESFKGPLKKRMCLKVKAETESHPFRPWSPDPKPVSKPVNVSSCFSTTLSTNKSAFVVPSAPLETSGASYFRPPSPLYESRQDEPISLVKREKASEEAPRVPVHPQIATLSTVETERIIMNSAENFPALACKPKSSNQLTNSTGSKKSEKREQRNYKNMTRERRIEANARERTRVHTISAAFDTLRRAIPSYSHNQKLSKLSVLRIACSYIMTLSNIVNDGGEESSTPEDNQSISECVDLVSKTIQREGKLRKKKDDND